MSAARSRKRWRDDRPAQVVLLLGLLLVGCPDAAEREANRTAAPAARRLIAMAPAAGEMLDELQALELVVGVGDFVTKPAALAELPRVGAYDAPNVERILELEADAFVTAASQAAAPAHSRLEALGVAVVALDTSTYEGVFAALDQLGRLVGRQERAAALETEMRARLRTIEREVAGAPRRRVLFVVGRDPLYVAGPGSHIDEMIELVGGVNVAADAGAAYQQLSMEAALERMPDVIVDTSDNRPGALRGRQPGAWGEWGFLPAVQGDGIHWVDPERLVIPGIRLPEMTRRLGRLVHPELFGEPLPEDYLAPVEGG